MHAIASGVRSLHSLSSATVLLALALAACLAPGIRAQASPPTVIGGIARGSTCEIAYLGPCPHWEAICDTNSPAPTGATGGMAYDPINQLTWHTDGTRILAAVNMAATPCESYCGGPSPIPNASGLAFDASTGSLWVLGLAPEIARTVLGGPGICPQLQSRCSLAAVIPAGTVAAGLALSEKHGLLFYSASSGGNSPVNFVFTAPISDPCRPICRFDLGPAFGIPQADPILGLGFDDCTDELYVAAGSGGVVRATLSFSSCTATVAPHCTAATVPSFHGICLQPQPVTVVGRGCSSPPCPASCTALRLRANDATLGNLGFRVWNIVGPANSFALPVLGLGSCGPGVSALCGQFHPSLAPLIVLPPIVLSGPSTCTGSGVVPLPIPAQQSLCGATFCIQWIIGCPAGGFGLTQALTVRVNGG